MLRQGFASIVIALIVVAGWWTPLAYADTQGDFLKARDAWNAGDLRRFERHASKVSADSVFYPYVRYWKLSLDLENDKAITDFLITYANTWLVESLRREWLKDLGRRELWSAYVSEFAKLASPDDAHQCFARRAEVALGNQKNIKDAITLWFTGRDMPAACTPLYSWLIEQGYLREEDIWRRLRLAFEAGNLGVSRAISMWLPEEKRPQYAWIDHAYRDPAGWLASRNVDWSQRSKREVGLFALARLARKDTAVAAQALEPVLPKLTLFDRQYIWGLLALQAARNHEPQALRWFELSAGIGLSDAQREWWARAAMRVGDWPAVQRAIQGMSDQARNESAWRYWLGRALKASGQTMAANQLFAPLSRQHDYYGQLAEEELGAVLGAQPVTIKIQNEEIDSISRNAGIVRALALLDLGLRTEATQEWNWEIRNFDDRQLLAAAELARRNAWYDRAINTAVKTRDLHDFELRFLAPFRELASREARKNGLDEAWVFGLIRQESRFIDNARSSAGARGLMQIMPATGRWIAERLGIRGFNTGSLAEPETNLKFGSYYLRYVKDSLDGHPVLATAAYNAGPRRAERWRSIEPMEGAVYVESIPFSETRNYVKSVMNNAMHYAHRFNQPSVLLRDRLGVVPPRRVAPPAADDNGTQPNLDAGAGES